MMEILGIWRFLNVVKDFREISIYTSTLYVYIFFIYNTHLYKFFVNTTWTLNSVYIYILYIYTVNLA